MTKSKNVKIVIFLDGHTDSTLILELLRFTNGRSDQR